MGTTVMNLELRNCPRTAELGYWLGEPFWGRGIMTGAVRAFTAWAFPHFDLVRIYAELFANNAASIRLLEKASFTLRGDEVVIFPSGTKL